MFNSCDTPFDNICFLADSYKHTHDPLYPPDMDYLYAYLESRGGLFPTTTFFGLQYLLERYLKGPVVTKQKIELAQDMYPMHFGSKAVFKREAWDYILNEHHGYLPVRIVAVPEGLVTPTGTPLIVSQPTDPKCRWLGNYLETLLVQTWYPTTVCTLSSAIYDVILEFLNETGTPELIDQMLRFKLHDFGMRGVSSPESAAWGGLAHLVNFLGTDTPPALIMGRFFYDEPCAGFSIPASEHSTITSWGEASEFDAYENFLNQYPEGPAACVSDSYNILNACRMWGSEPLRSKVLSRNGVLVIRPDSGEPVPTVLSVLEVLGSMFPTIINSKGFRVLDSHVRIIQGDGVDQHSIHAILRAMADRGWSTDNIAFGMGGALLQKLYRDTQNVAFKASATERNGEWHDVFKNPVGDSGKRSKAGRVYAQYTKDGAIGFDRMVLPTDHAGTIGNYTDLMRTVFVNGHVVHHTTLADVRARARQKSL